MAFGTSSAVFCFFRTFTIDTGMITCNTQKTQFISFFTHLWLLWSYACDLKVEFYHLGVLEQHRGKEAHVGVGDIQPAVIRHLLLQSADVG